MPFVELPEWDARGLLPPCNSVSPTSSDRSPYRVSLKNLVLDFAVSAERVKILQGLLSYRSALHALGIMQGFQWLDGSFFEHIEMLEQRPPGDIDVVTFFDIPQGHTQLTLKQANPGLFPFNEQERVALKKAYSVDAFTQSLEAKPQALVGRATYWYSMWSHRRDMTWKGYVEVDLAPSEDAATLLALGALPPQQPTLMQQVGVPGAIAPAVLP
jgi:hypothetical protein